MLKYKRQINTFYATKNEHHYLLNLSTSEYYCINENAALIWTLLSKPMSSNSLLSLLKDSPHNFDPLQIELYLYDFLDELVGLNLITLTSYSSCKSYTPHRSD
jgi:hypothetical protein